jgi:Flp pilus assembly pilin Flp
MLERIQTKLLELHRDEDGLTVVEIVLLIALIVLPLVLALIFFGKDIKEYIKKMWGETKKGADELQKNPTGA